MFRRNNIGLFCIAGISILLAISITPTTMAQCGPNGCVLAPPTTTGIITTPSTSTYQWRPTSTPDQVALYRDGIQLGNWRISDQKFVPIDRAMNAWAQPIDRAPIDVPSQYAKPIVTQRHAGELREANGMPNFGIDLARISPKESYSLNGREVSRERAMTAVAQDGLDDDSEKLRVTIIGSETDCDRVRKALESSDLQSRVHVRTYRPNDPMVSCGFVTSGSPTVYVQDGRGQTLHRQDTVGNTEQLVGAVREAERRRKPNYDPAKDPDLTKSPAMPDLSQIPKSVWIVLGGLALFFIATRKLPPHQPNGAPK